MKVNSKRHAAMLDRKERDAALQVVLQGHAITIRHLSYLIPTGEYLIPTGRVPYSDR